MLPLDDGETVQDRYLALREVAKHGARFGPDRRRSHAAAVEVALEHLAQVAGFPDASRLEWECETGLAAGPLPEAHVGDYSVALRMEGAEPVIAVTKAGKPLKSVPAAVRSHPSYAELREQQERLRDQARRLRTGLIERLVATGGSSSRPASSPGFGGCRPGRRCCPRCSGRTSRARSACSTRSTSAGR